MAFDILLFDLDGTLTDPKEGITKCVQYALAHFGIDEPDLERLTAFIGPPLDESFMVYYGLSAQQAKTAIEVYRSRFSNVGLFENKVYTGIKEMLARLKQQGKILAVATSKPTVFSLRILEKFQLLEYFDVVVGSELDGTRSNKADVIAEVLRQLKIPKADYPRVLMIGDRLHDVRGAKAHGLKVAGVQYGYAPAGELAEECADYILDTVAQLNQFLTQSENIVENQ